MTRAVELPLWLFVLIVLFAAVTFASHFLFPSVRWFLRRRAQRLVDELNKRLEYPIQPFKLARRVDTIQRLRYDPDVIEAVSDYAHETGLREDVAFETASRYAREIVPGFSATAYFSIAMRAARWLSTLLYDVRIGWEDKTRATESDATVIYVMNHRSNLDYVLVTYLVANRSALSYAVGEWARIWPLRPLIRALGGYFIRRRSRNALYRRVLARYVQMATTAGVTQAMFPEGGLSQSGYLGKPKLGLLNYVVSAFDPEGRDVVFVPVALNYDRVVEDTLLVEARRKGEKRFRGTIPSATAFVLRYAWRRMAGRVGRFGTAGVSFGEPLSLKKSDLRDATAVAEELMRRIAKAMPIVSVPLVASVVGEEPVTREEVLARVARRLGELRAEGAAILTDDDPEAVLEAGLIQLVNRRILVDTDGTLSVAPGREDLLKYYAASMLSHAGAGAETMTSHAPASEPTET